MAGGLFLRPPPRATVTRRLLHARPAVPLYVTFNPSNSPGRYCSVVISLFSFQSLFLK